MRCIHINDDDNIAIVVEDVPSGAQVEYQDVFVVAVTAVPRFNKIALENIPEGAKVRRYGLPIGVASRDILRGEFVHVHNLRSAWIPTFTREQDSQNVQEGASHAE